jgi:hypothetical protein
MDASPFHLEASLGPRRPLIVALRLFARPLIVALRLFARALIAVMKHRPEYFLERGMVVECEDMGACEKARKDGIHLAEWLVTLSCDCILAFCEKATDQVKALTDIHKCPRCMTRNVAVAQVSPLPTL